MTPVSFQLVEPGPRARLAATAVLARRPRGLFLVALTFAFPVVLLALPNLLMPSDWSMLPVSLAMGAGAVVLLALVVLLRALVQPAPRGRLFFDEDGIGEERDGRVTRRAWTGLTDVVTIGDGFLLVLGATRSFQPSPPERSLLLRCDDPRLAPLADLVARHTRFRL